MIEEFDYYLRENLARKEAPDAGMAKALMTRALERLAYAKQQCVEKSNASFVFEDAYEAVREASQALMALKGFKPYSHEAVVAFLKKFYSVPDYALASFDRFRKLRNKCVYGAEDVTPQTCLEALAFAASFIPELKKNLERDL
ncbi:MAG: HEPN domain-containing protein [Candidatus Micrarchaeota archaeon]